MYPKTTNSVALALGKQRDYIPRITASELADINASSTGGDGKYYYKEFELQDGDMFFNTDDHHTYQFSNTTMQLIILSGDL